MCYLARLFTNHPKSVGESYLEHAWFAWKMGVRLARCSTIAFIHGCFPCWFETSVSEEIGVIHNELENRFHID